MVNVSVVIRVQKDNFTESLESALNQTLEGIEIICLDDNDLVNVEADNLKLIKRDDEIDEVAGKYLYFLNPDDVLEPNSLKEYYQVSEKLNLDFLQLTDDDEIDGEVYAFDEFKGEAFKQDMTRYTKFFRTDFIKRFDVAQNDYLLYWDCMFNAKRFALYTTSQKFTPIEMTYEECLELIDETNRAFSKFTDYGYIGGYKHLLFDWRVDILYNTYRQVPKDKKLFYFRALKKDFTKMLYHWRFADFAMFVQPVNKIFFDSLVYNDDFETFKKLLVHYEIELDTVAVEKENEIIKSNISMYNKENNRILNSTSWKITKPLRGLK